MTAHEQVTTDIHKTIHLTQLDETPINTSHTEEIALSFQSSKRHNRH